MVVAAEVEPALARPTRAVHVRVTLSEKPEGLPQLTAHPELVSLFFGSGRYAEARLGGWLTDHEAITFGESDLTVLHTPGHSPGGICLYSQRNSLVFTGDTLFAGAIGRTDIPGGNYGELLDSINTRLLALPDETIIYPGHGPSSTIGVERVGNPWLDRP